MHKGKVIPVQAHSRLMHWYRWQSYRIPLFNEAARFALSLKYFLEPRIIRNKLKSKSAKIDAFYQSQDLFFVFSTIRSGSTFLTDFFTHELKQVQVEHEPNINDYWSYTKVLRNPSHAKQYIQDYRLKDLYHRWNKAAKCYGEFNPFLLLHCREIKEQIPKANIFHLVRDGREVVRSIMSREVLGKKDPLLKCIRPPKGEAYHAVWSQLSRFEKVCWKWQHENKVIRQSTQALIQLEQLLKDYDYFQSQLLDPLGLQVSRAQWQRRVKQPQHASPRHQMPHWKDWTKEQQATFEKFCKNEMNHCGYELSW